MRQMMSQQRLWNQLEGFTHQIHGSLDLKETAYAVVNDGKRLVGCDRLSVALKIAGRIMVEAVSGQEVVEQRSNLVRELTRLCKVVIRSGEDLVYTGNTEGFAPDIRDALEIYVDESGSKVVVVTLLHKPEQEEGAEHKEKVPFGCLVAEQIGDEVAPTDMHARTEVVSRHASTALWNSQEHHKIFLQAGAQGDGLALADSSGAGPWPRSPRVLAAILALIGALYVRPLDADDRGPRLAPARGAADHLRPDRRHRRRGPRRHGDRVKKGDVIARLDSKELQKELKKLIAERDKAESQTADPRDPGPEVVERARPTRTCSTRSSRQLAEARITAKSAKEQIEIIQEQIESMIDPLAAGRDHHDLGGEEEPDGPAGRDRPGAAARSPPSAAIPTGSSRSRSPTTTWGRSSPPRASSRPRSPRARSSPAPTLSAYFVTATDPEHRYQGYVRRIASKAETVEQKHVVKVTVGFDEAVRKDFLSRNQELRPGAEVRARVDCGKARLAYYLLRNVVQVWYESVLFRWPFLQLSSTTRTDPTVTPGHDGGRSPLIPRPMHGEPIR